MNTEILHSVMSFIKEWYLVPLILVYLGVLTTILIENRNPTKTIAWILVIVFIPVVGLITYYLFGQKFKKVKRIRQTNQSQYDRLVSALDKYENQIDSQIQSIRGRIGGLSSVYQYLRNQKISIPTLYNEVKLLINGEEKFEYLLQSLEDATQSIHLEYYIFEMDTIGREVLDILKRKHQEGVEVRLMVDSFGSPALVRYLRRSKEIHFEWHAFRPVTFASLANSNYRNHRKIAIIDGEEAFIGGINISDRYINSTEKQGVYWRDTSVRIKGDAVGLLQISFWDIWIQAGKTSFKLNEEKFTHLYQNNQSKYTAVSLVQSNPGSKGPFSMEAILISLGEAKEKVQLVTPYYIPSEELETSLMMVASTGVEVELMLPKTGDSFIVQHATFSFLKPLLQRGVKVYLYEKGFVHAKTVNVDGKLAFVGTVNLDIRSFYINYEVAAVISEAQFCKELGQQFELDKQYSQLLTLEDYYSRNRWKRAMDSLCRLLAPLL